MREESMLAWYEASAVRRSRRAFDPTPLGHDLLERLREMCDGFHPFPDARVALVAEPTVDVFSGVIGSYGKITGAPHLLCVIATVKSPHAQQHAGYVGEAAILEATTLGLGTCWVGGFFDAAKASTLVNLESDERILAVSPVGMPTQNLSGAERTMRTMAGSHNRKPIEKLVPEGTDGWPSWALAGLECARIAPSAINRQPWRFAYREPDMVISRDSIVETPKVTKALDCGIAMLHMELGALSQGVTGTWKDMEGGRSIARFTPAG
jgi:nitroreductase